MNMHGKLHFKGELSIFLTQLSKFNAGWWSIEGGSGGVTLMLLDSASVGSGYIVYHMAWRLILPETTEHFLQCLLEQKLVNKIASQSHLQNKTEK